MLPAFLVTTKVFLVCSTDRHRDPDWAICTGFRECWRLLPAGCAATGSIAVPMQCPQDSHEPLLLQVLTPKQFAKAAVHSYPFFPNANMIANLAAITT